MARSRSRGAIATWTPAKLRRAAETIARDPPGFVSAAGFGNRSTIDTTTVIPENINAVLYGPITISEGASFTISAGSNLKIKDFSDA